MNINYQIENTKFDKLIGGTLIALAFTIPIHKLLSTWPIVLLLILWLVNFNRKQLAAQLKSSYLLWASLFFYAFSIIGIVHSVNNVLATEEALRKISIILLPLILSTTSFQQYEQKIRKAFVISTMAMSMIMLITAYCNYLQHGNSSELLYVSLTKPFGAHPAYFSLYCFISIVFLFFHFLLPSKNLRKSVAIFLLIGYLVIFMLLLFARTVLFISLMISLALLLYYLYKKINLWVALSSFLLSIFIVTIVIITNEQLRNRITDISRVSYDASNDKRYINSDNARVLMWQIAADLIKEKPFTGVGSGDVKEEYMREFVRYKCYLCVEKKFNTAHNQYLHCWLSEGLFYLLAFIGILYTAALQAYRKKQIDYVLFLLVFALASVTESTLQSQSGIVYFALFNTLFYYNSSRVGG